MANDVVTKLRNDVAQPATSTLPTAADFISGLRDAVTAMEPDDVILEVNQHHDQNGSRQHLSLRAYKKSKQVIDEERNG